MFKFFVEILPLVITSTFLKLVFPFNRQFYRSKQKMLKMYLNRDRPIRLFGMLMGNDTRPQFLYLSISSPKALLLGCVQLKKKGPTILTQDFLHLCIGMICSVAQGLFKQGQLLLFSILHLGQWTGKLKISPPYTDKKTLIQVIYTLEYI